MSKVKLTTRAVEERVRRALAKDGISLRKSKGGAIEQLGDYYGVDLNRNTVEWTHQTLPQLVSELKILKPWEQLTTPAA